MAKDKSVKTELSRDLTLFQLVMMGLGMMIGAGVFLGIGNAIFYAGPGGVLLTFTFNGLLALFTAIIPRAGGAYNFTRIGFGKQISFQAGWMEWFASSVAGSMYTITFSLYTIRYILVSFASIVAVKADWPGIGTEVWKWIGSYREKDFGEAISYLIPFGNFFLTLAVIFASTSALNTTIFSATRSAYALGRDKMLSHIFTEISVKRKTPWGALFLTGVIVFTVITFLPTMDVASCASIMFTTKKKRINLLIMGWRGKRKNTKYQLGSTLDPVITKAPCDLIVLKDSCKNKKFYNILIPIFGSENDMFALECAKKMIAKEEGIINLFYFENRLLKPAHINNLCQMQEKNIKIRPVLSNKNDIIVETILYQSLKNDLLIIGMKESRLMSLGIKSDTEQIAEQCTIPFIFVKRTKGIEGLFKRRL